MVILISGTSHTGKTNLSQHLINKLHYPCLSIDHLKMGLIRSGYMDITVEEDEKLTAYMWPILSNMIKTAIENDQHMIMEGCYIPFDWKDSFSKEYLDKIKYCCLIMSEEYMDTHFDDVKKYGSVIENRGEDEYCDKETLKKDNVYNLEMCRRYGLDYFLIDKEYDINKMLEVF